MEEKTIKVSIDTARKWYESDNETLKTLALQAFTEDELKVETFENIKSKLKIGDIITNYYFNTFDDTIITNDKQNQIVNKLQVFMKLNLIAIYYNNLHNDKIDNYFIGKSINKGKNNLNNTNFFIGHHDSVRYPGIVYFNKESDAVKAFNILKDDFINNF